MRTGLEVSADVDLTQPHTLPRRRLSAPWIDADVEHLSSDERVARAELANDVNTMRWLSVTALPVWVFFAAVDWVVHAVVQPLPLALFAALRALGAVVIGYTALHLWRGVRSRALYTLLDVATFATIAALLTVMTLWYRALLSPYSVGILVVVVCRGAILADRWERATLLLAVPIVAHLVVLAMALPWSPLLRVQLADPVSLALFGQSLALLGSAALFLAWGSHLKWSLRRQVYEARMIGRYRLRRPLARGGMAEVWVAYHPGLRRDVALKLLRAEGTDAARVRRFEREVAATTELTHPNTVRIFDYGVTDDGIWYYAMELLEGRTLTVLVQAEGRLPPERAVRIAYQVARALAEAHRLFIFHRDIKPDNIFITEAGGEPDFAKVLDFGIARVVEHEVDVARTNPDTFCGTPAYISPEVAQGDAADARADVYALGAVLYFMLTGLPPFQSDSAIELMQLHVEREPEPLHEVDGIAVPRALSDLVSRCLAKAPEARFFDGAALATALAELRLDARP